MHYPKEIAKWCLGTILIFICRKPPCIYFSYFHLSIIHYNYYPSYHFTYVYYNAHFLKISIFSFCMLEIPQLKKKIGLIIFNAVTGFFPSLCCKLEKRLKWLLSFLKKLDIFSVSNYVLGTPKKKGCGKDTCLFNTGELGY